MSPSLVDAAATTTDAGTGAFGALDLTVGHRDGGPRRPGAETTSRTRILWAALEIALLFGAWRAYSFGRYLIRDQEAAARRNAERIVGVQEHLRVDVEAVAQSLVVHHETFIKAVNHYYVFGHVVATVACLVWCYVRAPGVYRRLRSALIVATAVGLVVHAVYPLAPPRLVDELDVIDTLRLHGPSVYPSDPDAAATNQFAAMPSFHVGWAALVAWAVVSAGRSRMRWLAVAHPAAMAFAVTVTANHYVLDGVVGTGIVMGALYLDRYRRATHADAAIGASPADASRYESAGMSHEGTPPGMRQEGTLLSAPGPGGA